jgi:hypothetical protein
VTSRRPLGPPPHGGSGTERGTLSAAATLVLAALVMSLIPPCAATAAEGESARIRPGGWGLRAGFSSAPEQFVLGIHYDAGEPARRLRFMPNIDVGVGDRRTVWTANPDLVYSFPFESAGSVYAGGSCGVVWRNWRGQVDARGRQVQAHHNTADLGVAGIFGYRRHWSGRTVFLDARIRISDAYPGVKVLLGTNFGS